MATPSTFARWRTSKLLPPIAGPMDELFAAVFGAAQDEELALLRVAALSRLPATCPDDGLDLLGQTFVLERVPDESHDSYRARLQAAFSTYELAGAPDALEASLRLYGFEDITIVRAENFFYEAINYSAFGVELGPDFGTTGITADAWGAFPWGDPLKTWGSTATPSQLSAVVRQILKWKAAHGLPLAFTLLFGGTPPDAAITLVNVWGGFPWGGGSVWGTGRWIWGPVAP